jgi:nucleoside-diphosphate-sugar epimerase
LGRHLQKLQKYKERKMRVFIAGATGVLGRRLIQQFRAQGDTVVGLVRGSVGERAVTSLGGEGRHANLFDADALAHAAEGCDVVIHAATSIPVKTKPTPEDWEMNDQIRRNGTRALTDCAAKIGARLYIQQSVIWVARPLDGSFFDEDSPSCPDSVSVSALDGENIAREAGAQSGFDVTVLRCGWFYGADAPHTKVFADSLRKRQLPIISNGNAVWACLHLDDAASAFLTAAKAKQSGIWHIVDDYPVRVRDFIKYFAERLAAPSPLHVPVWLARLAAGSYATDFFTLSSRTSNSRFRRDFGWIPQFPSFKEGIDQSVANWSLEETLHKKENVG